MLIDTWFGDPAAPLLGFLHQPADGSARSGVVICPPFGYGQIQAYRAMRFLGQELAARGIAALRFDYLGEGDSSGATAAPDSAEGWLSSIRYAVDFLRASGIDHVTLLGLGSGALLASEAAADNAVASLVLWDPELSGRRFIRRQRSLFELTVAPTQGPADESHALLSFALHPSSIEWLEGRETTTASLAALGIDTLVLGRVAMAANPALQRLATADVSTIYYRAIDGQEELLEAPAELAVLPLSAIATMVDWLDQSAPDAVTAMTPLVSAEAIVGTTADGSPIIERLRRIGEHELFAIETVVVESTGGLIVLQPGASEHRVGPGRFQVLAAREIAERGARAVRFDRRITGDTTEVVPDEPSLIFAEEWVEDTHALITEFMPSELAYAGLCAGGWVSARSAERHPARLTVLMSPNYFKTAPLKPGDYSRISRDGHSASKLRELKGVVRTRTPGWLWRVLSRFQLFHDPAVLLHAASRGGSTIALLLPPEDGQNFSARRGPEAVTRLRRRGADVRAIDYTMGDHSLFGHQIRQAMMDDLLSLIAETMTSTRTAPASKPGLRV